MGGIQRATARLDRIVTSSSSGILFDGRWIGPHGIGRFAAELLSRFPPVDVIRDRRSPVSIFDPLRLTCILRERKPRVFFSPGFNVPLSSVIPFVFTIHDLIPTRVPEETTIGKRTYYRAVVRPAVRRAFCVITVSQFSRREVLEWTAVDTNRVTVVPLAPAAAFVPDGERHTPGYPYLLYVGRRKPHKNLSRCLQAFARAHVPLDIQLVLTGEADAQLTRLAQRLGILGRLVFAGSLSDDALAAWYRGALAVLIPSLYEGFGLPALEAMACGTPVVAANATALPEVVGDAAVFVDPRSVDSIAEGIQRVVDNATLRDLLRRRGTQRAAAFDWTRTAEKVWDILVKAASA